MGEPVKGVGDDFWEGDVRGNKKRGSRGTMRRGQQGDVEKVRCDMMVREDRGWPGPIRTSR
jgi:hypothetical protein